MALLKADSTNGLMQGERMGFLKPLLDKDIDEKIG
jgi:hypothetical protein